MASLEEMFATHGRAKYYTDKGDHHSYLAAYDELFKPYQNKPIKLFECGFAAGGDLKLFEDYFPLGQILGIDIVGDENIVTYGTKFSGRVKTVKYDLHDLSLDFFIKHDFIPDIAIDDSSHTIEDQVLFVKIMYPIVNAGGLIVIEDVAHPDDRVKEFNKLGLPYNVCYMNHLRLCVDNVLIIYKK